jgi:PAS domain S-box-containing protein
MYIVDSNFRIAVMNAGSQMGTFRNVPSAIGRDFGEAMRTLWPEPVAAEIIRILRRTLDTGEPYYSHDFVRRRHDIEAEEAYEWELHRITLPDGQYGVICYYFDSTKLRQTEQALRGSEQALRNRSEQLAAALAASDTGTFRWNPHTGEFLEFDDNLKRLVGQPDTEFKVTEDLIKFVHPDDLPALLPAVETCRRGADLSMEYRVLQEDGNVRWLSERAKMEWEDGKPTYLVGACTDITERKRSEEALLESEQRLRQIEKIAAAGKLAASLAHEINNPVSTVRNVLYLLDHSGLEGDQKTLVKTAGNELARVSRIVRQSLSYYRVGTVPKEVELAAILEESLEIFSERMQRKNIQLSKKISSGNRIMGFADEIRQVIDNLLLNALEAMPGGGRLAVSLRRSHNWNNHQTGVRLTIGDSGYGVPRQHLSRIFEPFFTTKAEKGTGLGLWVVRGIVAKHEGQIDIRSRETRGKSGTVVSIFWPSGDQGHSGRPAQSESAA